MNGEEKLKTKIAKWVIENTPRKVSIVGDLDYRGVDRKEDCGLIESFSWLRKEYPQFSMLAFHPENEFITNGGSSYVQHAMSFKKGRIDGICDFILLSPSLGSPNLLIEFKRQNIAKSLSSKKLKEHFIKQMSILGEQSKTGAECYLCLDSPDSINFKKIIKNYCNKFSL